METAGIPEAIENSTQKRFGRSAIDQEPMPFDRQDLHCGGCTTPVSAVRSHDRRGTQGAVAHVAAHYRLRNRETHPHDDSCRYDWDSRTGTLVTDSRGVLSKRRDYFELQLPGAHDTQDPTPAAGAGSAARSTRVRVRRDTQRVVPRMLASARGIARLLADMQDPELAERFRANYQGELIGWDDFFIDLGDPVSYPERLRALHRLAVDHPLAVAGTVLARGQTRSQMPFLDLSQYRGVRSDAPRGWLHARVIAPTIDLAGYRDGQKVLAYGTWKTLPRADSQGNVWVSMFLDDPGAITRL